jgi:hypothetical protein
MCREDGSYGLTGPHHYDEGRKKIICKKWDAREKYFLSIRVLNQSFRM